MEISKYIGELLQEHDCVIIPGFGGFVCNYHPAQIHPEQHSFRPPSKKILFNKELKANDGLLASHIAINLGISFEVALSQLADTTADLTVRIESGERIRLEKIGRLHLDSDGNIQFEQDNTTNYLKDSYGLATFISPPIQRNIHRPAKKTEPVYADRKRHPEKITALRAAAYWSSGIAATFLLISMIILNFDGVNNFIKNETGFLPTFSSKSIPSERIAENTDPVWMPVQNTIIPESNPATTFLAEEESIPSHENNADSGNPPADVAPGNLEPQPGNNSDAAVDEVKAPASPEKLSTKMYHLIAGSFEKAENADGLISDYTRDGYDPKIIGQAENGNYRVSIAAYLRKDEALAELEIVRVKYNPNIWVLRQ